MAEFLQPVIGPCVDPINVVEKLLQADSGGEASKTYIFTGLKKAFRVMTLTTSTIYAKVGDTCSTTNYELKLTSQANVGVSHYLNIKHDRITICTTDIDADQTPGTDFVVQGYN